MTVRFNVFRRVHALACLLCATIFFAGVNEAAANGAESFEDLLELRGHTRIGGVHEFSVYNKEEERSRWLRMNERKDGYLVESYDPDTNELVIRFNRREGTLYLQGGKAGRWVESAPTSTPDDNETARSPSRQGRTFSASGVERSSSPARANVSGQSSGSETTGVSRQGTSENRGIPGVLASRDTPETPPSPPSASPPSDPEQPDGAGDNEPVPGDDGDSSDSPPPLPPTPPPNYTPE